MPKAARNRTIRRREARKRAEPTFEHDFDADLIYVTLYASLTRAQYCLSLSQQLDLVDNAAGYCGTVMAMAQPMASIFGMKTIISDWQRHGTDLTHEARRAIAQRMSKQVDVFLRRCNQPRSPRPVSEDPPPSIQDVLHEWDHNPHGDHRSPSMDDVALSLHIATIVSAASAHQTGLTFITKANNPHLSRSLQLHCQAAAELYILEDEQDEIGPKLPHALLHFEHITPDLDPEVATLLKPALALAQEVNQVRHKH